jgi:hypothetical protein
MTKEELVKEFSRLPVAEREAAAEEIQQLLNAMKRGVGGSIKLPGQVTREEKLAALSRLEGMLKTAAPPPTDEELKEDYINYVSEKYS